MSDFDISDDDLDLDFDDLELVDNSKNVETSEKHVSTEEAKKPQESSKSTEQNSEQSKTENPKTENPSPKKEVKNNKINALDELSDEDFDNIDIDNTLLDEIESSSESIENKKKPVFKKQNTKTDTKQKLSKKVKNLLACFKKSDLIEDRKEITNTQLERKQLADRLAQDPEFDRMYKKAERRYFKNMLDSD